MQPSLVTLTYKFTTSEFFSANVGGAGEISIGDADADVVNLRGDIVLNGVYGTATPPATLGPLEGANFMLDAVKEIKLVSININLCMI